MRKTRNIYKTENGTYRVRKYVNGVRLSKNFVKLKDAKEWLLSLLN